MTLNIYEKIIGTGKIILTTCNTSILNLPIFFLVFVILHKDLCSQIAHTWGIQFVPELLLLAPDMFAETKSFTDPYSAGVSNRHSLLATFAFVSFLYHCDKIT